MVLSLGVFLFVGLTVAYGAGVAPGFFPGPIIAGYVLFAVFVLSELARMAHAAMLHQRA